MGTGETNAMASTHTMVYEFNNRLPINRYAYPQLLQSAIRCSVPTPSANRDCIFA